MSAESKGGYQIHEWESLKGPFNASYGKVMMWYFLISDTFIFAAFLVAYAAARTSNVDSWPMASEVFNTVPGLSGHGYPLVFVSFMTFILIISSVTMVRAVQEGHMMNKMGVVKFVVPTILMGLTFLGCQYLEWTHLYHEGMWIGGTDPIWDWANGEWLQRGNPFHPETGHMIHDATTAGVAGKPGSQMFSSFFFTITGFHGLHVITGVILNIWLLVETLKGRFEKIGSYEMVEKVGLFWHFVDLVWVYVFLAYYLL